ncbi:MAG TPA: adenylyltransferase/cytidyltransferase family protein [Candidatus Limnocylindria bacterium]|nr:adenylyltransferase/cytidyltransferase family protein [Candidatus Limnocylindria bacterium]
MDKNMSARGGSASGGKTVAISGGFDPVHVGHIELMEKARALSDRLVVIMNNDNWLVAKKGFAFMPEKERAQVLKAIRYVDDVVITQHEKNTSDMSVCVALEELKPDIFANGGDRKEDNIPEYQLCDRLGIEMVFNLGDKIQSSSDLVKKVKERDVEPKII